MLQKPIETEREKFTEEDYDEMLDECYGEVEICGCTFDSSYALKELDPTAYRCGFNDFQEYETVYECPICGIEYEDEADAIECCQDVYECECCWTQYDNEEEADNCCADEEEDEDE